MNHMSTRELLYLEDSTKLFESIEKTCDHAISEITDPQVKSLLQTISRDHKQWIQSSASLINKGRM